MAKISDMASMLALANASTMLDVFDRCLHISLVNSIRLAVFMKLFGIYESNIM